MAMEDETAVAQTAADEKAREAEEAKAILQKKAAAHKGFHYVVREPFGDYRKGHTLTHAETIVAVHDAGHAGKLIRVRGE